MKFCFIPIRFSSSTGFILDTVKEIVQRKLDQKKVYLRFADVPVTPQTIVLRIDKEKGRKQLHVWECAHSKIGTWNGEKQRYYKTSFERKNRIEFLL